MSAATIGDRNDRQCCHADRTRRRRLQAAPRRRSMRRVDARCGWRAVAARAAVFSRSFSSLTRRIVVLNLAGLVVLVIGILYLNQFRDGLIDARVQA